MTLSAFRAGLIGFVYLTTLLGCGDGSSVKVCFGDAVFCNTAFNPIAKAGPDQTVAAGDIVTLNGSNSEGNGSNIKSYSWTQTNGPQVTLTDANAARATFVAPAVAGGTDLTFRLTVTNDANLADSSNTVVTVLPPAAAAVATALELFDGALRPALAASADPVMDGCASATVDLPADQAAAQRGLWLAARVIAIAGGVDTNDPSSFLDRSRLLVAQHAASTADVAGRIESFGFLLLGTLTQERDPALHDAVAAQMAAAATIDDPAALLSGRTAVTDVADVAIEDVADPAIETSRAIARLLASRSGCVAGAQALRLTADGLRVIAAAAEHGG
jgi:hypothetical protein